MLCPKRKAPDGSPAEPKETEINSIVNDAVKLKQIRTQLSDISWWMRLMCQKIDLRANNEDPLTGRFWKGRFKAVKILDATGLLACAFYVPVSRPRPSKSTERKRPTRPIGNSGAFLFRRYFVCFSCSIAA